MSTERINFKTRPILSLQSLSLDRISDLLIELMRNISVTPKTNETLSLKNNHRKRRLSEIQEELHQSKVFVSDPSKVFYDLPLKNSKIREVSNRIQIKDPVIVLKEYICKLSYHLWTRLFKKILSKLRTKITDSDESRKLLIKLLEVFMCRRLECFSSRDVIPIENEVHYEILKKLRYCINLRELHYDQVSN